GAGAELWEACVGLARKEAIVRCQAKDLGSDAAKHYDDYVRERETLGDIAPHRWLAMRRGVRENALEIHFEFPQEAMLTQVELQRDALGDAAKERESASILDELVLDALATWLTTILDQEAEGSAITAAAESLSGLLHSSPLQARRLVAIFVGRAKAPVGAVVTDREGELLAHRVLKPEGAYLEKLLTFIKEYDIHHVVMPTNAPAGPILTEIQGAFAKHDLQVVPIRPAAIAEARRPFTDPPMRLGPSAASALVLARRALDPIKEWALVDPVSIGIAEYQHDLNSDRLRATLKETVELSRLERRRGTKGSGHNQAGSAPRGAATMARLNPLVKTIADLRGGMTVHGVVTNISHFGAFINIGLPQEALVHISELSDRFVSNPNEVVSIGQQVSAHVLAVDPPRGRISLSLKTQGRAPLGGSTRRDDRPSGGAGRGGPPRSSGGGVDRAPPRSRAEALASLEQLFKK
ncbi:MAG: S1 RNA-binding domain-containing protein, partial [Deltaproteobacteria bacterium]|nr:S1 RNA-binding domain-containing protein [Deltaproteobacteria bacterium]